MKFTEAIKKFDRANGRAEIPNLNTGEERSLSSSRRDAVISNVRSALHRATDVADVGEVDIDPYAETLVEHARRYAQERGLSSPSNYVSNVRLFLTVVEGRTYHVQRWGRQRVLPEWEGLYNALEAVIQREDITGGSLPAALLRLQNLAHVRDIRKPQDLPGRETIKGWVGEEGLSKTYSARIFRAYRLGRKELDDPNLPILAPLGRPNGRGIRSLSDIQERLLEAGCEDDPREMECERVLHHLAPKITEATRNYINDRANPSPALVTVVWGTASRFTAEAARQGLELCDLHYVNLFRPTVEAEIGTSSLAAELVSDTPKRMISPMDRILEAAARKSWQNSPLKIVGETDGTDFIYTGSVEQEFNYAYRIMQAEYEETLQASAPDLWRQIDGEYRRLQQKMEKHNDNRKVTGQKDKELLLETITLPQLVCIGLPALARKVRRLRDRYYAAVPKHETDEIGDRTLHEAKTKYFTWLRRYVITAVITDDGLRTKNYAGAVHGQNVLVTPEVAEPEDGSRVWTGVDSVRTLFRGFDDHRVSLKKDRNENDGQRKRSRILLPGIVDHELFFDYWVQVRPYDLARAGELDSEDEFDPDDDGYALFVSCRATNPEGCYKPGVLSKNFGKTLLWICDEVLDRDVPDWDDEERTTTWRELFGGHISRLLIATYWGGLREKWSHAEFLTNDKKSTLLDAYDKAAEGAMQHKFRLDGWEHPRYFDDLMDRIREGETVDWEKQRQEMGLP